MSGLTLPLVAIYISLPNKVPPAVPRQKENPSNFLLMHAMGPNVSGVIGSAVAAGILLTLLK